MKKKQSGFALVLSLVLLLVMSLMGGALIVIASSDHSKNTASDRYIVNKLKDDLLVGEVRYNNNQIWPARLCSFWYYDII